jgi:hypothetical protein
MVIFTIIQILYDFEYTLKSGRSMFETFQACQHKQYYSRVVPCPKITCIYVLSFYHWHASALKIHRIVYVNIFCAQIYRIPVMIVNY